MPLVRPSKKTGTPSEQIDPYFVIVYQIQLKTDYLLQSPSTCTLSLLFSCGLLFLLPLCASGQETDTTAIEIESNRDTPRTLNLNSQLDRPATGGLMSEMGTHEIPRDKQYYQHPFKGQEYLDMAVEAYREEMGNQVGDQWYWQFLQAVSPYIKLHMEVFETMQMQYVDRDHPFFQSYGNGDKKK